MRTMWRAQDRGCSTAPNMIVMFERRPTSWAVRWASSHSSVLILSGQRMARTSSSRISAAVPGRVLSPASMSRAQVVGQGLAQALGPLGDLEGGEAVDVDVGRGLLHRPGDVDVVVAVEVGVDAALEADLGGAQLGRLDDPAGDVVQREQVRAAPQVQRQRALGEAAEPALERADVRVVDVAVVDEGDDVAHGLPAQLVGHLGHGRHLGPRAENRVTISSSPTSWPARTPSRIAATAPPAGGSDRGRAWAGPTSAPEYQWSSRARPSASLRSRTAKRSLVVQPAGRGRGRTRGRS